MRIVGGDLRGRPLAAPTGSDVRPTNDRVREALFNILAHAPWSGDWMEGGEVLDACCGTGALGLEALSRGAATCHFLDNDQASLDLARRNAQSLGAEDRCRFMRANITNPPMASVGVALVLLDAPYHSGLATKGLAGLDDAGWIAPSAVVVLEMPAKGSVPEVEGFEVLDNRRYGQTQLAFLRRL